MISISCNLSAPLYFRSVMAMKEKHTTMASMMLGLVLLVNAIILKNSCIDESPDYRPLLVSVPLLAVVLLNCYGNKNTR